MESRPAQSQQSGLRKGLTPEQYLQAERAAEFRSEYYNGHIYAMSGGSYQHFQIIGNITGELHAALKKRSCSACASDLVPARFA